MINFEDLVKKCFTLSKKNARKVSLLEIMKCPTFPLGFSENPIKNSNLSLGHTVITDLALGVG